MDDAGFIGTTEAVPIQSWLIQRFSKSHPARIFE
jgi:hypothetical protein